MAASSLLKAFLEKEKLKSARDKFFERAFPPELRRRVERALPPVNSAGFDPWGLHPETVVRAAYALAPLYRNYFRVETSGIDRVPPGRVMLIANHGGQIPVDGLMVALSLLLDAEPPRIVRAMVERWVPTVPWISSFFLRAGEIVGHPQNCRELLRADQAVLVFPEGVRGSGKLFKDRYRLQRFGTGFARLALEASAPVVPVALIGTEEAYPGIMNLKPVARLLGAPYFPVTPFFPILGPLGMLPVPAKITIRFGEPLRLEGAADDPEERIERQVERVKEALRAEIREGLKLRGEAILTGAAR
jgi:1-acyl-sn-glycerol-3-phosphate acyltransferase